MLTSLWISILCKTASSIQAAQVEATAHVETFFFILAKKQVLLLLHQFILLYLSFDVPHFALFIAHFSDVTVRPSVSLGVLFCDFIQPMKKDRGWIATSGWQVCHIGLHSVPQFANMYHYVLVHPYPLLRLCKAYFTHHYIGDINESIPTSWSFAMIALTFACLNKALNSSDCNKNR